MFFSLFVITLVVSSTYAGYRYLFLNKPETVNF